MPHTLPHENPRNAAKVRRKRMRSRNISNCRNFVHVVNSWNASARIKLKQIVRYKKKAIA
jgi:hypothetical protein